MTISAVIDRLSLSKHAALGHARYLKSILFIINYFVTIEQ